MHRLLLFLALLSINLCAQDTPIKGLEPLRVMVGVWNYTAVRLPLGSESVPERGNLMVQEVLDGTYLRCEFLVTDRKGGKRQGIQHLTWSPAARRFELLTIYAGNASRVIEVGKFDPATRTLHLQGEYVARNGAVEQIRARIRLGEQEMTYENDVQLNDGKWHTDYRAVYQRN